MPSFVKWTLLIDEQAVLKDREEMNIMTQDSLQSNVLWKDVSSWEYAGAGFMREQGFSSERWQRVLGLLADCWGQGFGWGAPWSPAGERPCLSCR